MDVQNDIYDRIWMPTLLSGYTTLMANYSTHYLDPNSFSPPTIVMETAIVPDASDFPYISWQLNKVTDQFYFYMHFAEVQLLQPNESRQFNVNVYFNGKLSYEETVVPRRRTTIYTTTEAKNHLDFVVELIQTSNSTLPPVVNGLEIYTVIDLSGVQTNDNDVDTMLSIKSIYGLSRNWQGDPCGPKYYVWAGINCSNDGFNPPRIISLNLSSSQLGVITPSISNLKMLQTLDLSNNNFTGPVPDFLSQMDSLKVLYLKGNNFSSVPKQLLERSKSKSLSLSVDLFAGGTSPRKKKENRGFVPVVASVLGVAMLMIVALITLWFIKRRKSQEAKRVGLDINKRDRLIEVKKQQFTYSDILRITKNFQRVIGKGGFGTVYHGFLGEAQVAVKMLSPSSIQGYKEFQEEANLLMSVHHKNLTSFVGYCNEGTNMGIIYEYMANGNLEGHLYDKNPNALSWEERLRLATDAAQGLEYLHHGCKPPIVHRDVKCSNILLNENFQAKLADFGLSRPFSIESGTHVSTNVAGTPGYLDPEYWKTHRLREKSDVYSFGIVLHELITGQPAVIKKGEDTYVNIKDWVAPMIEAWDIKSIIDPRLQSDYNHSSASKAVEIARACVQETSKERPTMSSVTTQLKECLAMTTSYDTHGKMRADHGNSIEIEPVVSSTTMGPEVR